MVALVWVSAVDAGWCVDLSAAPGRAPQVPGLGANEAEGRGRADGWRRAPDVLADHHPERPRPRALAGSDRQRRAGAQVRHRGLMALHRVTAGHERGAEPLSPFHSRSRVVMLVTLMMMMSHEHLRVNRDDENGRCGVSTRVVMRGMCGRSRRTAISSRRRRSEASASR
eukprot:830667-Rhodomonas_salina.2